MNSKTNCNLGSLCMMLIYFFTFSLYSAQPTTALDIVLAKSSACFSAATYSTGYTFNPPQNGEIIGIRLVHTSGSVTCSPGAGTNWGCVFEGFFVQMIKHDGGPVYYPTNATQGVNSITTFSSCANGCIIHRYYMSNYGINNASIELID